MITAQSCSTGIEVQCDFLFFQVGYKELCIHMANLHGGLERVMAKDKRQGIKDLVKRLVAKHLGNGRNEKIFDPKELILEAEIDANE